MTTTYNLQKLIAQTVDVELLEQDGTKTGVTFTLRASHDPRIQTQVSQAMATLPAMPTEGAQIGELVMFNTADQLATRKIMIARTVRTNHPELSTPEQISEFLSMVDYNTILQLQSESSDRELYFR